jgi:hypothetical protein
VHLQPAHRDLGYQEGQLPHAEAAARQVLSLPLYPELPMEFVEQVSAAVLDVQHVTPERLERAALACRFDVQSRQRQRRLPGAKFSRSANMQKAAKAAKIEDCSFLCDLAASVFQV